MTWEPKEQAESEEPASIRRPPSGWLKAVVWTGGIVGAIAVFLGLFILFAGENQYVGLGGDWSWRVGDISSAWAYGLLAGGVVLLLIVLASTVGMARRRRT